MLYLPVCIVGDIVLPQYRKQLPFMPTTQEVVLALVDTRFDITFSFRDGYHIFDHLRREVGDSELSVYQSHGQKSIVWLTHVLEFPLSIVRIKGSQLLGQRRF